MPDDDLLRLASEAYRAAILTFDGGRLAHGGLSSSRAEVYLGWDVD